MSTERIRLADVSWLPAGAQSSVVFGRGLEHRLELGAAEAGWLRSCDHFASVGEHARRIADQQGTSRKSIRRLLEKCRAAGLMDSLSELRAPQQGAALTPMSRVIMITKNRAQTALRGARSVLTGLAQAQRQASLTVFDDTSEAGARAEVIEQLCKLSAEIGLAVRYSGKAERDLWRAQAQALGLDAAALTELTDGTDAGRQREGANRNSVLLDTLSERFLTVDDDIFFEHAPHDQLDPRVRLDCTQDPTDFRFFRDRAAALRWPVDPSVDALGIHDRLLGRPVREILHADGSEDWWNGVDTRVASSLRSGRAFVAVTAVGALGDSGMGSNQWYLHMDGSSFDNAAPDDATWSWTRTARAIHRCAPAPTVSSGLHMMGMTFAADHTRFLPPFDTAGRNVDGTWAVCVRHVHEDGFIAHLPWAIRHDPPVERAFAADGMHSLPTLLRSSEVMRWVLWQKAFGRHASPQERWRRIVASLAEVVALDPASFHEWISVHWLQRCSALITGLDKRLVAHPHAPAGWTRDVHRTIDSLRGAMTTEPSSVYQRPTANRPLQDYQSDLGRTLMAWKNWTQAREAATELKARGHQLSRLLPAP